MTTRNQKDRAVRRAIGWGAAILLIGFILGAVFAFVPVATGWAADPPFGLGAVMAIGSTAVGLVGLGLIIYGFVQMGRSRPPKRELDREREHRRLGPWDEPRHSS